MNAGLKGTCVVSSQRSHRGLAPQLEKIARWPVPPPNSGSQSGFLQRILPGIVTGASDVDPALVLTATVAGVMYRYSLLWSVLLSIPFLLAVFSVSARIGLESRQGLVDLLRGHYGRRIALICALTVVAINMAMIVADLMAVTDALSIIMEMPRMYFIAAVSFSVWYILVFRDYRKITQKLVLLSLPLFIYVAAAVLAHPAWKQVISHSLFPRIPPGSGYPTAVIAIFGSLLTPYVLVWQTSSGREFAIAGGRGGSSPRHLAGTIVTTVLCFSIMVAAATVLRLPPGTDLTTRIAAQVLSPAVGQLGTILFALGIIGAGMVALPVLVASMCYSVAEAMGWKSGLSEHPWEAVRFYVLISAAMFLAAALNFIKMNPVNALYWSMILAGVLTVPILIFILLVSNNRDVMRTTNTWSQNFWIGAATGAIVVSALIALWWQMVD